MKKIIICYMDDLVDRYSTILIYKEWVVTILPWLTCSLELNLLRSVNLQDDIVLVARLERYVEVLYLIQTDRHKQ